MTISTTLTRGGALVLVFGAALMLTMSAYGQSQERAYQQQEQQLKLQQQRLEERRERRQREHNSFLQDTLAPTEASLTVGGQDARCVAIDTVDFPGSQFQQKLTKLLQPFIHQCLSLTDLDNLSKRVSNWYLARGFITTRVYIEPQNLASGHLSLTVKEGRLAGFRYASDTIYPQQVIPAFPVTPGEPLNLRDLEQGLEQLNRLASNNVSMQIEPGEDDATSVVAVSNQPASPVSGSLGLSNIDSDDLQILLLDGAFGYDNTFTANDHLDLSFSSEIGKRARYSSSDSVSFFYDIPYGYWLFSVSGSYFWYTHTVAGEMEDFRNHGKSSNVSLTAARMLYRGQSDKLQASVELARKRSENYIEDVFLETSSRRLYFLNWGIDYTRYSGAGQLDVGLAWSRSVPWWDASEPLSADSDAYQFDTYSMTYRWASQFQLAQRAWQFTSRGQLFYAEQPIIGSEGISIGGKYNVRGYEGQSLFGYRGGYSRNEIATDIDLSGDIARQLRVSLGADIGLSNSPEQPAHGYDWLAGTTLGLALTYGQSHWQFHYSHGWHRPDYLQASVDQFDIRFRYWF